MGFICNDLVNGNVAEDGDKALLVPQCGNCTATQQQVDGKNDQYISGLYLKKTHTASTGDK